MVSTRRARSEGPSTASEGAAENTGSQAEISSRRCRKSTATAAKHTQLEPVSESAPAAAAALGGTAQEDVEEVIIPTQELEPQQLSQAPEQPKRHEQPADQQLQSHSQQLHPHTQQAPASQPPQTAAAQPTVESNHDSSDDSDWDFDGPDMLQNLAATIRSALETTTGQGRPPQQQPSTATSTSGRSMSNDTYLEDFRWRPATGLQLTVKAGQLVQSAAAALPPKQRQELAASGPQVQTSAVPELPTPTTAAASKPKALAKQTRAPSLDPVAAAKDAKRSKPETAGKQWFDLPAVKITDEVKRDLRLLRLRGAYDPKRFYRSFDETKFPKHFAVGTVVDDPLDYYGGRLSKGQRKASLTEQLLADSELSHSRKKRYNKLQEEANKWVKNKKQKTNRPRKTPANHRPKH